MTTLAARSPLVDPALLRRAVNGAGVTAHLQPLVDLVRGVAVGYEALTRFPAGSPDPASWFAEAHAAGLGAELEAAALANALAQRAALPPNTFLSLNVSPDVIDTPAVRSVWERFSTLGGIVVELTEQVPVSSYRRLEPVLRRLREDGAMIAIDDAGADVAGLQHLLTLRPDFVTLDRALVAGLDHDQARRTLVEMLGTLADRLDAWVVAEGVETEPGLDALVDLGVPLAQGYLLGRPAPAPSPVPEEATTHIAARAERSSGGGLRRLLEVVPACYHASNATTVLRDLGGDVAVVLDDRGRPLAVVTEDGTSHAVREAGLPLNLETPVVEAARRAMTRTAGQRFSPLVCIDNAGRYVGVVRVDRLVGALTDDAPSAPATDGVVPIGFRLGRR